MDLTFIDKDNEIKNISVSDYCFERLAILGFSKKVEYQEKSFFVEGEDYTVLAVSLIGNNRKILIEIVEGERQSELEKLFKHIDEKPTVKEVRSQLSYIKELTEIYKNLKTDNNIYFSYE